MKKLTHDLLTTRFTEVYHEKEFDFNAPHTFEVRSVPQTGAEESEVLQTIHFQEGPILKSGVNGVSNEDLISMVICRLEHFNKSEYYCRENKEAITKLEEALLWLRKRTMGREARGVLGTYQK